MTRVLVLGMSHVHAIRTALKKSERSGFEIVDLARAPDILDRQDRRNQVLRIGARIWTPPDMVCLSIGGNLHNWFSLLENPQKLRLGDVVLGSVPPPDPDQPDRQFVPRDMLSALFRQRLAEAQGWTADIHAHFPHARFLHLCAPPPVRDLTPLPEAQGAPKTGDRQAMINGYMAFDAAPPAFRMKVFQVQTELYREQATALGAVFLPPPPKALTPDGFLDRAFWDNDPTHGNAAYGRQVLNQILQQARTLTVDQAAS